MSTKLPVKTIQHLIKILERDYGILLSAEKANELGMSLLRLSRLALTVLARTKSTHDHEILNIEK